MLSLGLGWVKGYSRIWHGEFMKGSSVWYHPVFNTIVINGGRLL